MMITLKAALVGTSCIGVIAVGGVTYATVAHPHAGLRSDQSKVPDAKPAAPAHAAPAAPQCLPKSGLPKPGDVRHAVPQQPAVPQAAAPQAAAPQAAAPQAVAQQAQKVDAARKVPANLPHSVPAAPPAGRPGPVHAPGANCLPSLPAKGKVPAHPGKPHAPKLPPIQRVSCDTIKPAVVIGGPAEKSIILSRGLGRGTKHVEIITYKAHKLCKVTEKWVGAAGQWLKVERIKTPQPYSIDQLRQALQLPAGGSPASVEGMRGWQTPLGGAVLWYSESGFAMCVEGSPAYAPQLQDVATKLQQQAQQVR
jgi:hypothetical protein